MVKKVGIFLEQCLIFILILCITSMLPLSLYSAYIDGEAHAHGYNDGYNNHNSSEYHKALQNDNTTTFKLTHLTEEYNSGYVDGCVDYYQNQAINNYYNKSV
jgi:hypothetical protein